MFALKQGHSRGAAGDGSSGRQQRSESGEMAEVSPRSLRLFLRCVRLWLTVATLNAVCCVTTESMTARIELRRAVPSPALQWGEGGRPGRSIVPQVGGGGG